MFTDAVTYPTAFIAGLLSFFSPCILPLIPAYFTFITGFSLDELTDAGTSIRNRVIRSTIAYVLGFSVVFILMGASASLLGNVIQAYSNVIRIGGGILIILLGIHLTGIFRFGALDFEKRIHLNKKPVHVLGSFFVGMAFGAGWSPCIGPLLGSILIIAGNQETVLEGMLLLSTYSAGLAIPFIIFSIFINFILIILNKARKVLKYVNMIAGILLILMGIALITNRLVL
ncbi:MAG: cytochrome c biogenesis CcdA family protein [Desulfatirhabdiaceae bacterium]